MLTVVCLVAVLPVLANSVVGFTEPEILFTGSEVYGDVELDYSYDAECLFVDLETGEKYPCSFITEDNPLECDPGTEEECTTEEEDDWEPNGEWRFDHDEGTWYYQLDTFEEDDLNYSGAEEDVHFGEYFYEDFSDDEEDVDYFSDDEEEVDYFSEEEESSWYTSDDASLIEEETEIEEEEIGEEEDPEAMYFGSTEDREDESSYCYEMEEVYYAGVEEEVKEEEEEKEEQAPDDLLKELKDQFSRLLEKGYLKNSDKIQALLNGEFDHILAETEPRKEEEEKEPSASYCTGPAPEHYYPIPEYCQELQEQYYKVPEYCQSEDEVTTPYPTEYCQPEDDFTTPYRTDYCDFTTPYPMPPLPTPYYPNEGPVEAEEFQVSVVEEFHWEETCVVEKKRNLAMPVSSEETEEENRVLFQIREKTYAVESIMDVIIRDLEDDEGDFEEYYYDAEDYYDDDYYYDDYTVY